MESFFPYSVLNLMVGPIRTVAAKRDDVVTLPTKVTDFVGTEDPYNLVAPFFDFGASVNPGTHSRGNTQSELSIEQDTAAVDTEVTDVTRSLQFNVAEFSPQALAILEQSPGIDTIAAVSGAGSWKQVPFGTFTELDKYFVAFIGRRKKKAGLVTEVGGLERGRMVVVWLNNASITGDAQSTQFAKGALSGADVTFQGYPDPDAPAGEDLGNWALEDAGAHTP